MPKIDIETFRGQKPRLASRLLPVESAESCENCRFDSGNLEPWEGYSAVAANLVPVPAAIYLYEDSHWFSWDEFVRPVASPIAQDVYARLYWADSSGPRVTSNLIGTGTDPKPSASYQLGVPAPVNAPAASINYPGSDVSGDISDDETRIYVVTYVTEYGEEGPPSEASNAVTLNSADGSVDLVLPTLASNPYNVTHKRIYRSATTADDTDFFFVTQVTLGTVNHTDALLGTQLGGRLETETYLPPPANIKGFSMGANGMMAGWAGNEFMPCEPYLPYAFPSEYRKTTEHDIVAVAATDTGFVVGTKGYPYLITGVSPDSLSQRKIEMRQACVSEGSMVDMGAYVIYASPDGLVAVSETDADLLTKEHFDKRAWENYQPDTIHAYYHEDKYFGFYGDGGAGSGGFYFDMLTGDFCDLGFYAQAGYSDLETDTLYLVIANSLYQWRGDSANPLVYTWRSKLFQLPDIGFSCAKVWTASPNDVAINIYADGVLGYQLTNLPSETFRLPSIRGREWQLELISDTPVERVTLATSMDEL